MRGNAYRGRFAPSPTGPLHLGLARTALLGWLRARSQGGTYLVRVEDLDLPRVVPGAADAQLEDLRWLGLDWDEGPDLGGPVGPYLQSERADHYARALARLQAGGHLYPCTCSRREIAVASAPHGPSEWGHVYPGTCRSGPSHPGRPASLRFRCPDPPPSFHDSVAGPVRHTARGDFVVQRADGTVSYQLACVVDDIAMGITEVVRGDDLCGVTPWQLALYDALGAAPPRFAHVPLVLGVDGARLAKRHGAISVGAFREAGWSPERLVGWLAASCGLATPDAALPARALVDGFDLGAVRARPCPLPAP